MQLGFLTIAYPSLIITYLGQAAYLMVYPENYSTTFYSCIPTPVYWPMFVIAVLAAIVASQVRSLLSNLPVLFLLTFAFTAYLHDASHEHCTCVAAAACMMCPCTDMCASVMHAASHLPLPLADATVRSACGRPDCGHLLRREAMIALECSLRMQLLQDLFSATGLI